MTEAQGFKLQKMPRKEAGRARHEWISGRRQDRDLRNSSQLPTQKLVEQTPLRGGALFYRILSHPIQSLDDCLHNEMMSSGLRDQLIWTVHQPIRSLAPVKLATCQRLPLSRVPSQGLHRSPATFRGRGDQLQFIPVQMTST